MIFLKISYMIFLYLVYILNYCFSILMTISNFFILVWNILVKNILATCRLWKIWNFWLNFELACVIFSRSTIIFINILSLFYFLPISICPFPRCIKIIASKIVFSGSLRYESWIQMWFDQCRCASLESPFQPMRCRFEFFCLHPSFFLLFTSYNILLRENSKLFQTDEKMTYWKQIGRNRLSEKKKKLIQVHSDGQ